jgi:hypothetical protein
MIYEWGKIGVITDQLPITSEWGGICVVPVMDILCLFIAEKKVQRERERENVLSEIC